MLTPTCDRRIVLLGSLALFVPMGARAQSVDTGFVVKDLRTSGANSVRFAAAQGTELAPNIVLLGGNKEVWPKIRGAVMQAKSGGFPVRAILIGPPSAPPALEIYAKGHDVTNPINPYEIKWTELVHLILDVYREYYPR